MAEAGHPFTSCSFCCGRRQRGSGLGRTLSPDDVHGLDLATMFLICSAHERFVCGVATEPGYWLGWLEAGAPGEPPAGGVVMWLSSLPRSRCESSGTRRPIITPSALRAADAAIVGSFMPPRCGGSFTARDGRPASATFAGACFAQCAGRGTMSASTGLISISSGTSRPTPAFRYRRSSTGNAN